MWVLGLGVVAIVIAIITKDVVAALTIAYDILVGGLLVAILGGLVWKRGTGVAAAASMAVGSVITLGTMIVLEINAEVPLDGVYANEPIYYGLLASALVYVAVSLLTKPTDPAVMKNWHERVAGRSDHEEEKVPALSHWLTAGLTASRRRRRLPRGEAPPSCVLDWAEAAPKRGGVYSSSSGSRNSSASRGTTGCSSPRKSSASKGTSRSASSSSSSSSLSASPTGASSAKS